MKQEDFDIYTIEGKFVVLEPYSEQYINQVLELRNKDNSRYYLNQTELLSYEQQKKWTEEYFNRENDLYWVILDRETNDFLGTTSLYDLSLQRGEKGRLILDEHKKTMKPYALEAEILLMDFAFTNYHVNELITCTREDNYKMESINKKLGFTFSHSTQIRGVKYNYYKIYKSDYSPLKPKRILAHWEKR